MSRKKDKNETEHLRGEIRKLESENKALKRRLRHLEKRQHIYENTELPDLPVGEQNVVVSGIPCHDCGKGMMKEIRVLNRVFFQCEVCGERTKATIVKD